MSIASGCCSVPPKEETSRNPAIGGAYGLWQARDPCAIRRAIRPCPIPCHLTPWPGHRTTTRFKRQPAAPAATQCRKQWTRGFKRQPLQIAPSPQDPQLLRSRGPEGELRNRPTSAPDVVMAIFTWTRTSTYILWKIRSLFTRYLAFTRRADGAHLAYTRRRTREPKIRKKGAESGL